MGTRRVLTGMRTTGRLHLGHYAGALIQWLEVAEREDNECFFLLADVQALTTHAQQPEILSYSIREVVLDWLAVGLDPNKRNVHFVLQSQVPERYELSQLLSMVARFKDLEDNPTLQAERAGDPDVTAGFMMYPLDQVADICMVSPTPPTSDDRLLVPVGEDQAPHIEYQREVVRRFHRIYKCDVFVESVAQFGTVKRLPGTDGPGKMGKSARNSIDLADTPEIVANKVRRMYTDPNRTHADVPGETKNNPVFVYHRAFNPNADEVADLTERYQQGRVGDLEVKQKLAIALNNMLDPIRDRRAQYERVDIREILEPGTKAARQACQPVIERVREAMHIGYPS